MKCNGKAISRCCLNGLNIDFALNGRRLVNSLIPKELEIFSQEVSIQSFQALNIGTRVKNSLFLGPYQTPHNGWRQGGGDGGMNSYSGRLYRLTELAKRMYDSVEVTVSYRCETNYGANSNGWKTQMTIAGQSMPLTWNATKVTFTFSTSEEPTWNSNITNTSSATSYWAVSNLWIDSIKLFKGKKNNVTPLVCIDDFTKAEHVGGILNQDYFKTDTDKGAANISLDTPGCNRVDVIYTANPVSWDHNSFAFGPFDIAKNNYLVNLIRITKNDQTMQGTNRSVSFPCGDKFRLFVEAGTTYYGCEIAVTSIVGYEEKFDKGVVIKDSKMNGFMNTVLYKGAIGGDGVNSNNIPEVTVHDCKFSIFCRGDYTDATAYMATGMMNVEGYTKCDVTFTSPILTSGLSDLVTVSLSDTLPKGYFVDGYVVFTTMENANINEITSVVQTPGKDTCTVTLEFSEQTELSLVFRCFLDESDLNGKTKTIQIDNVKFYN